MDLIKYDGPDYLFRFPTELRLMIFRHVLIKPKGEKRRWWGGRTTRILETCKWIHAEAATLLYEETKFVFRCGATLFFDSLSQKYCDAVRHVKIIPDPFGWLLSVPNLRNLKTLSFPLYPRTYQQALELKRTGLLMEEMQEIRQLLVLRGLTTIVIKDPEDIPKYHASLVGIKNKLDALIIKTVKLPRKTFGGAATVSMDCFI